MSIIDTAKAHPAASIGILALGLLILYLLVGSSGSAAAPAQVETGATDTSLQVAALQAGTAFQTAQLQAQSQDKQIDAALQIANLQTQAGLLGKYNDNATAFDIGKLQAQVASQQISADQVVSSKQIDANTSQTLAQLKQTTDIAAITSAVNLASIDAGRSTSLAGINAQADTARLISNNSASVAKTQSNNSLFGNILGIAGSLLAFL